MQQSEARTVIFVDVQMALIIINLLFTKENVYPYSICKDKLDMSMQDKCPCNNNPWFMDSSCVKYMHPNPSNSWKLMAWTNYTPLPHGQQLCEVLSPPKFRMNGYWPRIFFVHCDVDLGDMTLGQGHDTPLGHG